MGDRSNEGSLGRTEDHHGAPIHHSHPKGEHNLRPGRRKVLLPIPLRGASPLPNLLAGSEQWVGGVTNLWQQFEQVVQTAVT